MPTRQSRAPSSADWTKYFAISVDYIASLKPKSTTRPKKKTVSKKASKPSDTSGDAKKSELKP